MFIARQGRSELTNVILTTSQVADLVERMLRTSGRRIDLSAPLGDALKGKPPSVRLGSRWSALRPHLDRVCAAV